MSMEIKNIFIFPFKSLHGIEVKESLIDKHGFLHDRIYMLVQKNKAGEYKFVTQRSDPSLARIITSINGNQLTLSYEKDGENRSISLPLNLAELPKCDRLIEMELWSYPMKCFDMGSVMPEANQFFRDFLGPRYPDLTFVASAERREVPKENEVTQKFLSGVDRCVTSSFQDLWPGSLMTTSSCENIVIKSQVKREDVEVDCRGFRMNLIVDCDEPYVEDDWLEIKINGHTWYSDSLIERCPMPAVDQDKGEFRPSKMPLPVLNSFRVLEKGRAACFGINLVNKDYNYVLKVGDRVEVVKYRE